MGVASQEEDSVCLVEWEDRLDTGSSSDWICPSRLATCSLREKWLNQELRAYMFYFCGDGDYEKHLVVVFVLHKVEPEPDGVNDAAL